MRIPLALALALAFLAPITSGAALPLPQDDARSGGDAPSGPVGAVPIAPGVVHAGRIYPPVDPSDWFAFAASAGDRLHVLSDGNLQACLNVRAPNGATVRGLCSAPVAGAIDLRFTLATSGTHHIEFYSPYVSDYWISYTLDGGVPPRGSLDPGVASAGLDAPQDDAASGRDAPASAAGAVPILPRVVHHGNLTTPLGGPTLLGDRVDTFTLDADAGDRLSFRLAGTSCLHVVDPRGRAHAAECGLGYAVEAFLEHAVEDPGPHLVVVSSELPDAYRFSFGVNEMPVPVSPFSAGVGGAMPQAPAGSAGAHAVLAFVDDGINPYHAAFRDDSPRAYAHPSTYLPGYPEDAVAIHLTFGFEKLRDAVAADCAQWEKVEMGKLYWFPGTRIVGALSLPTEISPFDPTPLPHGPITCDDPSLKAYGNPVGRGGHGTMVASRAAANSYGACPDCLLVMVQGFGVEHVRWASAQPWIDAQSHSWGPITPLYAPTDATRLETGTPGLARAAEEGAQRMPAFWAAGNGAFFRYGLLGHPTQLVSHFGPSVIRVGATDSGQVALWGGGSPHVVSDGCASWAAEFLENDVSAPDVGSGTSAATPFVSGTAARVVREVRAALGDATTGVRDGVLARGIPVGAGPLADGELTMDELRRALFLTADPRPTATPEDAGACTLNPLYFPLPLAWEAVPHEVPQMPITGYGAVTRATGDHAIAVLLGARDAPERPREEAWDEDDAELRRTTYPIWTAPSA